MAIDVDCTLTGTGCVVTASIGIIADEGNHDSCITSMIFDVLHVRAVGEIFIATASSRVLIFGLVQNDRSTVGDLRLCNGLRDVRGVAKSFLLGSSRDMVSIARSAG